MKKGATLEMNAQLAPVERQWLTKVIDDLHICRDGNWVHALDAILEPGGKMSSFALVIHNFFDAGKVGAAWHFPNNFVVFSHIAHLNPTEVCQV